MVQRAISEGPCGLEALDIIGNIIVGKVPGISPGAIVQCAAQARSSDVAAGWAHCPASRRREHARPIGKALWLIETDIDGRFDLQAADAPEFERYSADFDPMAGIGWVDIRVPLKD